MTFTVVRIAVAPPAGARWSRLLPLETRRTNRGRKKTALQAVFLEFMVGERGFEPPAPASRTRSTGDTRHFASLGAKTA